MSLGKEKNVTTILMSREYGGRRGRCRNPYRAGLKVLSTLISSGEREYRKVMEVKAPGSMVYDNKILFYRNLSKGYTGYGRDLRLCLIFDVRQVQGISGFGHVFIRTDKVPLPAQGHQSCFIASLKTNWLLRFSSESVQVLERVCVLPQTSPYVLRELDVAGSFAELVVKAVLRSAARQQNAGNVAAFALFRLAPLQFVGMFEMKKEVFGESLLDAETNGDLLFANHKRNCIKIHSLVHIVDMFRTESVQLFQKDGATGRVWGQAPDGLPFNIRITEEPPVLITVKNSTRALQFGGNPWHYLSVSPRDQTVFRCFSVVTGRQLEGNAPIRCEPPEEYCFFHHDDSSRLISLIQRQITSYKICEGKGPECYSLQKLFSFGLDDMYHNPTMRPCQAPVVTASGRIVKVNQLAEWTSPVHLPRCSYEDELGLMYTAFSMSDGSHCYGTVTFYDNETGERLLHVELTKRQASCKESCIKDTANDEDITVDLDTVVVYRKGGGSVGEIFRLFEPLEGENVPLEDGLTYAQKVWGLNDRDSRRHQGRSGGQDRSGGQHRGRTGSRGRSGSRGRTGSRGRRGSRSRSPR